MLSKELFGEEFLEELILPFGELKMATRNALCYRNVRGGVVIRRGCTGHARRITQNRSYTRIANKNPDKNYIGASPQMKIRQFNMGNPLLKYDTVVDLLSKSDLDIKDNAIESVRMTVNRKLVKDLGKDAYFMKVRIYPSQIYRENKQAQGAGADRVSQGMTQSFGVPIGRGARVRAGQVLMSVLCMDAQKQIVKTALGRAKSKFPCKIEIIFHKDIKSLGTLPSKLIEEKVVEVKKEVTAEGAVAADGTAAPATDAAGKPIAAAAGKDAKGAPAAGAKGAPAPAGKDAKGAAPAKDAKAGKK